MTLYLTYVMMGISIAMPIGAISVEMIKQGLKNGFLHGWAVGLGGMTIDIILIVAFYFGLSSILNQPFIQIIMWIIGAVFLLLIGYDSIKNADHDIALSDEKPKKSWFSSYRNGFLVAISPGNIVFWLSVFGSILTSSYDMENPIKFIKIGAGVLTGILLHDIGLLTIVSTTRKIMNRSMIKISSIVAGILLIGFSGYFIYEAIYEIKQLL